METRFTTPKNTASKFKKVKLILGSKIYQYFCFNYRNLWNFLERLKLTPHQFVSLKSESEEVVSDTGSWDTDFEDDDENEDEKTSNHQQQNQNETTYIPERSINFRYKLLMFQNSDKSIENSSEQRDKIPEVYQKNYESESDYPVENIYMNENLDKNICPEKKQLETCSLFENLNLESSVDTSPLVLQELKEIFSHPKCPEEAQKYPERTDELPRPPVMLTNFDLLKNLPTKTDESEDEYEQFDEKIIEQNQKKFASCNSINKSTENFTSLSDSCDDKNKDEEIYESITETVLYFNFPFTKKKKILLIFVH